MHVLRILTLAIALAAATSAFVITVTGCAPVHITDPTTRAAYTANEVLIRVERLQLATIDLSRSGALDKATAQLIVRFTVDTARIVRETPLGWKPTVVAAWAAAKKDIPALARSDLQVYVAAIDAILDAVLVVQ